MKTLHGIRILLLIGSCLGFDDTWYKGCSNNDDLEQFHDNTVFRGSIAVADCAHNCYTKRFLFAGVQLNSFSEISEEPAYKPVHVTEQNWTQDVAQSAEDWTQSTHAEETLSGELGAQSTLSCICLNISSESADSCSQKLQRSSQHNLPVGVAQTSWAVYASEGPFLTMLNIETDVGVAVVEKPVAIEIHVTRAAALNVTQDNLELGHQLDIRWKVRQEGTSFQESVPMRDFTHILHRPKYKFEKPGNYTIDVEVTNGISTIQSSLDLEVVYSAPRDLQVRIPEDIDLPSCVPEEFKVTEQSGQIFVVFVDTPLQIDAAVSMGTNLTFTFWFEDTNEDKAIQLCENCTSVSIEHVYEEMGMFKMLTSVYNVYGHVDKHITVLVIQRQFSNLTIDLHPASEDIVAVDQPVHFIVSLITTSRSNRSLQVWYGEGHSNIVSLADTKSPRLVLAGNGKEMEIIASYGEGCRLLVEFYYTYKTEGVYKPKVAVYENRKLKDPDRHFHDSNKEEGQQIKHLPEADTVLERSRSESAESFEHAAVAGVGDDSDKKIGAEYLEKLNNDLSEELGRGILVLSEIFGARIHTARVARCEEPLEINLLVSSVLNISIHWHIYRIADEYVDDEGTNIDMYDVEEYSENVIPEEKDLVLFLEKKTSETSLVYVFQQVGAYFIRARVRNAISSIETSFDVIVQCPIEELTATCFDEYIESGAELTCAATVQRGSDIVFHWSIEGIETKTYTQFENHTSVVRHRFKSSGIYDISLQAMNNVSKGYFEVETPVHVQDPIKSIKVLKKSPNLLGNLTEVLAIYQPKCCLYYLDVEFEFDFGLGRENYALNNCDEQLCWGQAGHIFYETGTHEVIVYAYNDVSQISKTVEVQIYAELDDITVDVLGEPVAGSPTRFVVLQNGKTMETADVYFTWLFRDDTEVLYTNSPVVEAVFNLPGNYTVFLNLTNPVHIRHIEVPVFVRSRSEVNLELLHDLYVTPGSKVAFDLQINSKDWVIDWTEVRVSYSDGVSKVYKGLTHQWLHTFHQVGAWYINIILVGSKGSTIETLTSYVMVQEPVTGLQLNGPIALAYQEYESCTWLATTLTGTNILYNWTLDDSILIPKSQYEIQIPRPGNYTVRVEAFNDVARQPVSASLPVLVQNVIEDVDLEIVGNLVGKRTQIIVFVAGYHDFVVDINYGDGENEIVYSSDPVAMATGDSDFKVYLAHVFEMPGEYNIVVNVSNRVSSVVSARLFIPIEDITLTTRSPWVIRSTGHVVVKAVVTGGRDLTFIWNFSDARTYEKPLVTSYPNQTSIAKHFYGMSGEYCVTFNVTGYNYPAPGVYAALDRCFLVVDPIDTVKLSASSNSSALERNATIPAVFTARLSGSHVVFLFDYGDGTKEKVHGTQLSPWNKDMTMFAEGRHSYRSVGEYKVKVTASNPLGNETAWLPHSFWVQEPPKDLYFYEELSGERLTRYVGRVGELVTMVAKVVSGTDVMFDWKLGDQTDLVKKGSVVSHQYMTAGVRTVYVTAYNKVRTLTRAVQVFINYEIQGVDLIVERQVISVKQKMMYTAVVRPDYPNIVTSYHWTFKSPTRSQGRGSYGGTQKYSSKQSTVPYTFLMPGECTATVTAQNAISNATSASVEIFVYKPILFPEIFIISNKISRLVNQSITFKYFQYSGTDVNMTWTFGDGSDQIITNIPEVEHTFTSEGAYNISLLAQNPVSSQTVHKMLFVLNKSYCNEPKVNIIGDTETKIVYSRYFTVEADITMDCNLTSTAAYHWSIDGHVTSTAVQMEKRVLVLPPRMLNYGKHGLKFKVEMLGTIVYASASRIVEVVSSPLVSKVHGGVFRRIRSEDGVMIDGSASFDPDNSDQSHLRYNWRCHYLKVDGTYGDSCFLNYTTQDAPANITHNGSCNISMDTAVLSFPGDCLVMASNFTFELTVSADGRQNGTSFQTVALERENPQILNVKIVRPYSMMDPVNPDRKLSFYVECTNCEKKGTKYEWRIKHLAGYNIHNYARAHDLPCVDKDGKIYKLLLENETDSDLTVNKDRNPTLEENLSRGDIDEAAQELWPFTVGSEVDLDMTTTIPLYPYGRISEGKSSTENRRHRSVVKDLNNIDYLRVEEQADSARRMKTTPRKLDIVEEKSSNLGRGVTRFQVPIEEGTPGESGSSGGRQYSIGTLGEEPGANRNMVPDPVDETENEDSGSGTIFLDKLVGSREDNLRQRSILELPMIRVNLPEEQTRTGLNGESLVIKPGFLKQGLTYFLEVRVTDEGGGHHGEAVSSFVVNESPVHGNCRVKPDNGVELDTQFDVMCQAWKDEHKPLMYEISYKLDKLEDRKLIYRGVNGEFPIRLPAGKAQNDYNVYVYIDILDGLYGKDISVLK
ncbi:polycystin-1-like [Mercenaria mercenaria]|uniref:polycystin-1-like n=1 Tax=Mercenaria mercenaria TaxID=6596 RepID=UPI00234ED3A3|nr:polycystin-1-like [Mercenaria mercenaria]